MSSILVIGAIILTSLAQQDQKLPVPNAQAQKTAEKLIRDIFKDDYAKSSANDKALLAAKLARQASDSKDDADSRFVLLREARDLSAQSGDVQTHLQATEELVRAYDLDWVSFKLAGFGVVASNIRTADNQLRLSQAYLSLSYDAALAGDGENAQKAAAAAAALARKSKDMPMVVKADAAIKELAEIRGKLETFKKATEVLASNPEDAPSNEIIGEWWCLVRGDWEKGLPYLAKGTDLKSIAQMELEGPKAAPDQVKLGDLWWDFADKKPASTRENIRKRSAYWYSAAIGQLSGLTRAKIEKRLKEVPLEAKSGPLPGTMTFTSADQLSRFRTSGGTWTIENGELVGSCPGDAQWATLGTAYSSISEVTIRARIITPARFNLRYFVGSCHFIFNHEVGNRTELRAAGKMDVINRDYLIPGKEQEITLRQDGAKVILLIDGKKIWEAEATMSGTISFQAAHGSKVGIRQVRIVGTPDPSKEVIAENRPLP